MGIDSERSIDGYLQALEEAQRIALQTLRRTILEVVPEAEDVISYGLPAFPVRVRRSPASPPSSVI